ELADLLAAIPFVSTAAVFLGYRREDVTHPLDGHGVMIPWTEGLRTSACTFFSSKFTGRAPEGHVLLRGFLGSARDAGVLASTDARPRRGRGRSSAPEARARDLQGQGEGAHLAPVNVGDEAAELDGEGAGAGVHCRLVDEGLHAFAVGLPPLRLVALPIVGGLD